jgi:capsular polysaccharide biosynthesis protein
MPNREILHKDSVSIRSLPANFNRADLGLFEHELKRAIPATILFHLEDVIVNSNGTLFRKGKILPESFASPHHANVSQSPKDRLKLFISDRLFKNIDRIDSDAIWITDNWSIGYFHWMTDALPRLFTIREKIGDAALLLPGAYQKEKYITSSLKPLFARQVKFINNTTRCKTLLMPSHTAPTGNYNESVIKGLRSIYINFYQNIQDDYVGEKVYISRSKARWSKIVNEEEVFAILKEFGFKTIYFEDYSFEKQVKIASEAKYMISNHGASLTNMLFLKSGGSVFELRRKGDAHNNCYFALACALNLRYFYQICDTENLNEQANTADLIVDCQSLRKNIEQMLAA